MTRFEFTERLRAALFGEMPAEAVEEHIRFYDRYIHEEIAKGKSEEEVLAGLGDARLIAKTILDTWQSDDTDLEYHRNETGQNGYHTTHIYEETYEENGSRSSGQNYDSFFNMNGKVYRLDKWYLKLIPIAIVVLVLGLIFTMFFGMMKLTILVLTSPIFWGVILLLAVWRWFFRRR